MEACQLQEFGVPVVSICVIWIQLDSAPEFAEQELGDAVGNMLSNTLSDGLMGVIGVMSGEAIRTTKVRPRQSSFVLHII